MIGRERTAALWALAAAAATTALGCGGRTRLPLPAPPTTLAATPPDAFLEPPDALSGMRPPTLPAVEELSLPNGMRLFLVRAHELPLVSIVYASRAGTSQDRDVTPGVDELLAEVLERRAHDGAPELVAYARPDVGVYSTGTWITAHGATTRLSAMLTAIAEITRAETLDEELVRAERRILVDEIVDASASYHVRVRAVHERMLIYGARDPRVRPWYGELDAFRAVLGPSELMARHRQLFAPAASALIVVGDVELVDVTARFQDAFASWSAEAVPSERLPAAAFPTPAARLHAFPVSGPATIALRERAPPREHADRAAFEVATALLGGMFGARINRVLREERGHTYGVHATLDDYHQYSILEIDLAVPVSHVRQTVFDLIAELRRVQDPTQIGEDELAPARATAIAGYRRQLETRAGTAYMLASLFLRGETLEAWAARAASLSDVTAADVARACTTWLRPDAAPILVSGDYLRMMELGMFIPGGAELILER